VFNDVDETIRLHLLADVPIDRGEIDISFERPTREWSGRLSRPALNLFLYDIRERQGYRDDAYTVTAGANGSATKGSAARRIDLSYLVTAWAREPEDEHRILGRVMASMYRTVQIEERHWQGALVDSQYPLLTRLMPPEHVFKPVDMWGVLDNDLRASLVFVATTPLDVFAPITGPMVRTVELGFQARGDDWRESSLQVAGVAHARGNPEAVLAGATVKVEGTGHQATTDRLGRFSFAGVKPGEHVLHAMSQEGAESERTITVPSENYDIEL
jgi:hypothetical protein